jgi:hypothetical protein
LKRLLPLAFLSLSACVPLPFGIPPTKIEAGAAVRIGDDEPGAATFPLRASFHLLQAFLDRHERSFDVGPGWGVYPTTSGSLTHGPFFEAGWLRPMTFGEDGSGWRFGVNGKGHYLLASDLDSGFGLTLQATFEWTSFVTGPFAECTIESSSDPYEPESSGTDSCSFGVSEGEAGIGFFVETSYAKLGGVDVGWVGGGLLFRIPMSIGIVLVPIWD